MPLSKAHADWLVSNTWKYIKEEAEKTKPSYMKMSEALVILIDDRFERHIINETERQYLYNLIDLAVTP